MKTINIAGIIILGFVLSSDKEKDVDYPNVCVPAIPPVIQIEKETVVEPKKPATESFSRPRKPCPPSGPGRR